MSESDGAIGGETPSHEGTSAITLSELATFPLSRVSKSHGPKRAKAFSSFGVDNVLDLLMHYPRRWIDRTREENIVDAVEGVDALVIATVVSVSGPTRHRGPARVNVTIADETGRLSVVFFNQAWRSDQLKVGATVAVFGRVGSYQGVRQMANPIVDILDDVDERPRPILAVYPQSEKVNLPSRTISGYVEDALKKCKKRGISDPLSDETRARYHLISRHDAFVGIHLPDTFAHKEAARRRLAFDELLRVQLVLQMRRRAFEREAVGIRHVIDGPLVREFHARLPYELTGAQVRVIHEIEQDLAGPHPMHRLLQGDVGAGKTVVAVSALLVAVQGGHQGALMAPTEVLAEQHLRGMSELLAGSTVADPNSLLGVRPVRVELLSSTVTGEKRREVLDGIASGEIDIVVGTHALIQESVEFSSLGVVVVDEQHRFGVEQRAALRDKGDTGGVVPDVLVMTATPIPRTAALTVYGDLDVSVLDEKPAGRTPIATRSVAGDQEEVWSHVRSQVALGRQAYVVCPLIDDPNLQVASAEQTCAHLQSHELAGLSLEVLHGRMKSSEKDAVMDRFRRGDTDVLVATTVIEVGVDVPNATEMVILDADRFGIAQLHQLRGRVGRGRHESFCWLVTSVDDAAPDQGNPRLQALVDSDDGFHLAEVDLDLRGEGTLMNKEQKGRSDLRLASLRRDRELVEVARDVARELIDDDPDLERHQELLDELGLLLRPEEEQFLSKN